MLQITNEQITAMNELLADHVIETTALNTDQTELTQYIRSNTDPSIILAAIHTANSNGMYAYVIAYKHGLKIISWRMDYWKDFMQS